MGADPYEVFVRPPVPPVGATYPEELDVGKLLDERLDMDEGSVAVRNKVDVREDEVEEAVCRLNCESSETASWYMFIMYDTAMFVAFPS